MCICTLLTAHIYHRKVSSNQFFSDIFNNFNKIRSVPREQCTSVNVYAYAWYMIETQIGVVFVSDIRKSAELARS